MMLTLLITSWGFKVACSFAALVRAIETDHRVKRDEDLVAVRYKVIHV
jgi:hypothetical protein